MQQAKLEKLQYLAHNFDPFIAGINEECLKLIKELELDNLLEQPFELTNEILRRIHEPDKAPTLH